MKRLESSRLRLRQWRESDLAPFAKMNADPEVMRYFPSCLSEEQSNELVERFTRDIDETGWGFWAAELLESADFIGFIGINYNAQGLPFAPCVEVGWRLAVHHWGYGFATEGARLALGYAFTEAQLDDVVSMTPVANLASRRVMKKLRMIEQDKTFMHPKLERSSPLAEHVLCRMRRDEWIKYEKVQIV